MRALSRTWKGFGASVLMLLALAALPPAARAEASKAEKIKAQAAIVVRSAVASSESAKDLNDKIAEYSKAAEEALSDRPNGVKQSSEDLEKRFTDAGKDLAMLKAKVAAFRVAGTNAGRNEVLKQIDAKVGAADGWLAEAATMRAEAARLRLTVEEKAKAVETSKRKMELGVLQVQACAEVITDKNKELESAADDKIDGPRKELVKKARELKKGAAAAQEGADAVNAAMPEFEAALAKYTDQVREARKRAVLIKTEAIDPIIEALKQAPPAPTPDASAKK